MNQSVLNWASALSGFAGAAALLVTLWEVLWRQRRLRQEAVAEKVVAWSVYEARADGTESALGGVLVVNASNEVAQQVDIRTVKAVAVGTYEEQGNEQRYGLIPPGTYYLPHDDRSWRAPALVDTSDGKFVFTRSLPDGSFAVVHLVPITQRPEPQRVAFLRYTIAGDQWHRDVDGSLDRGPGDATWDAAFTASETRPMESVVAPYQPNANVQSLVERLFRHLAVDGVEPTPNATAEVKPAFRDWGIASIRRTQRRGQGLRLFASADEKGRQFYISGGHDGTFPNDGLQLHDDTVRDKRLFPVAPQSVAYWDAHFEELVDAIREGITRGAQQAA